MEKKIAGLLGAVAALGTLNAAQAAPTPTQEDLLKANSYADLLEPIPNAAKILQALDEQQPAGNSVAKAVKVAQFYHHHHHHHHGYYHHHGYGPRVYVVPPRRYYRHHHHHHHHHPHGYYRY